MTSKRGEEVATKIQEILIELRAITGAQKSIVRFHSDAGKEFINAETKKVLDQNGICQSHTGGHDPKSSGLRGTECWIDQAYGRESIGP